MNVDNLPLDTRQRIDTHLDAIEEVLKREGVGREERRNIVDNVETQILEMLTREVPDTDPTLAQVEAILARMDRPEAYGHTPSTNEQTPPPGTTIAANLQFGPPKPGQPRLSKTALWGAICIGLSLLGWLIAGVLIVPFYLVSTRIAHVQRDFAQPEFTHTPGTQPAASHFHSWFSLILLAFILCIGLLPSLLGTLLGWIAIAQIHSRPGLLYGRGLAWFDALFYPLLVATLAAVGLFLL